MSEIQGSRAEYLDATAEILQSARHQAMYLALVAADGVKDISFQIRCALPSGYRLICADNRLGLDELEIALLNESDSLIAYYIKLSVAAGAFSPVLTANPMLSWCTPEAKSFPVARDIGRVVFFNYILERYDVIIPQELEFGVLSPHWLRRVSESIALGLYVCYYTVSGEAQLISTQASLESLVGGRWLGVDDQQVDVIRISKKRA